MNMFNRKKFWFSAAVPSRKTLVARTKENGGVVVKYDKEADFVIVNPSRKDLPPGSYSFHFIESCVDSGRIEDPERYLAAPHVQPPRPVGSSKPTKQHRTPFSAEDDRILFEWVAQWEQNGFPVHGNKIYQVLESKYPHHTFQSWRDRWVKTLQHYGPDVILESPTQTTRTSENQENP